jgi:hypothetical protein
VGKPFIPGNVPVEWRATNGLKTLWVHKVIPQNLSSAVISNAMVAGTLKPLDRVPQKDKSLIYFQDRKRVEEATRFLQISPQAGWIHYRETGATSGVHIEGVPSVEEAERLGLELLFKLGIDRTQFEPGPRPNGAGGFSKIEPDGTLRFIGTNVRHICFIRQIDGISFTGNGMSGGFWVEFGNNAQPTEFELVWRNLVPYELRPVASDSQILEFVRTGKAVCSPDADLRKAKKFVIKSLTPQYLGASGDEPQELVYPLASMDVEAELSTNKLDFELTCPILAPKSLPTR